MAAAAIDAEAEDGVDIGAALHPRPATNRRRRRSIAIVSAAIVGLWLAYCTFAVVSASREARDAEEAIEDLRSDFDAAWMGASPDEITDAVAPAMASLRSARSKLDHPLLSPVRFAPFVGRQFDSANALVAAGVDALDLLEATATTIASTATDAGLRVADGRVARLRAIGDQASLASSGLADIDLGPDHGLIGPLARRRDRVRDELVDASAALDAAGAAAVGVANVVQGPSRFLVLAANQAEMRNGSGMALSAGVLTSAGGAMTMSPMTTIVENVVTGDVAVDDEVSAIWSYLESEREWRNLGVTPRFDVTARQAATMWEASGHEPVDGVLMADSVFVAEVVEATRPVVVDGRTLEADDVRRYLLRDQYRWTGEREVRRDRLDDLASSAFGALAAGDFDVASLAAGLSKTAAGRHIMAWSADPAQQARWITAHVAGRLEPSSVAVGLMNRGGNKLDPYVNIDADLAISGQNPTRGTLTLDVFNGAPERLPAYVAGPHPGSGVVEGTYRGLVSVSTPRDFEKVAIGGDTVNTFGGADGPTDIYVAEVIVPRGAHAKVTYEFRVPAAGLVEFVPSARATPIRWTARIGDGSDVAWSEGERKNLRW